MGKYSAVCLDIGGTFIKYALIDEDGELHDFGQQKTNKTGTESLLAQVFGIIEGLIKTSSVYTIKGIGISSTGQVSHKEGNISFATDNLPGWTGVNLKHVVQKRFNLGCEVENDANAAALGEMYFGNARGINDFICIVIGTGIGGAIVKGSQLIGGSFDSAGEIGHMIIKAKGRKCNCGNRGCYEQYASVTAFKRDIREKLGKNYIPQDAGIECFLNKYDLDDNVKILTDKFVKYISIGIVNLLHVLNPSAIIIGGAISMNEVLIDEVRKNVFQNAMQGFTRGLKICPTLLGNKASLFGISTYVFESRIL